MKSSFEQFKKDFQEFPFSQADDMSWLKNMNYKISHISNLRRLIGNLVIFIYDHTEIFNTIYKTVFWS